MEEKTISFNEMDHLISQWLLATDDEISTFQILAQQINIQDMKIVVNEQKIFHDREYIFKLERIIRTIRRNECC